MECGAAIESLTALLYLEPAAREQFRTLVTLDASNRKVPERFLLAHPWMLR
jgi:hypothetical protein